MITKRRGYEASSVRRVTEHSVPSKTPLRYSKQPSRTLRRRAQTERLERVERCADCPYLKGRTCGPSGPVDAKLVIIGEAPGKEELSRNQPFIGKSGQLLRLALAKVGINPDEAYYTNSMRCLPPTTNAVKSSGYRAGIEACRERLAEEVLAYPRTLILTLGNSANRGLFGDFGFKITGKRGHVVDLEELGVVLPTFHPASILRNQGEYPRWLGDLKYAAQIYSKGREGIKRPAKTTAYVMLLSPDEKAFYPILRLPPNAGAKRVKDLDTDVWRAWDETLVDPEAARFPDWPIQRAYDAKAVTGIPAAARAVDMLLQMPELSADIETGYSYSPRLGKVIALSVAWSPTEAVVFSEGLLDSKAFRPHLERLLTSPGPLWFGHNLKYDSGFLYHRIIANGQTQNSSIQGSQSGSAKVLCELGDQPKGPQRSVLQKQAVLPGSSQGIPSKRTGSEGDEGGLTPATGNGAYQRRRVASSIQPTRQGLRSLRQNGKELSEPPSLGNRPRLENGQDQGHTVPTVQYGSGPVVRRYDVDSSGIGLLGNFHDTMLEHYCLDETKGTHDLESVARDLLGADDYKKVISKYGSGDSGYENVPREILYPYCSLDTTHTFSIHEMTCPKVHADKGLTKLYESLLLPASRFLESVQDHGLYVNQEFVDSLDQSLGAKVEQAKKDLLKEVTSKSFCKVHDRMETLWDTEEYLASDWKTKKRPDGYNPGAWRHNSFLLEKLIGWAPMNTNERTLRDLDQTGRDQSATFGYKAKNYARGHPNRKVQLNYPFIQALIDYRLATHAYAMMVTGVKKNTEPDGRLHTSFNLQATETGRLSSTNPNLQNLPVPEKDDPMPYRNIVGAPPGRVLLEGDYSQVELRLLAHYSNDKNLMQVYLDGRDLHTELSIAIWGDRVLDADGHQIGGYTNYQRVRAKAVNFGIAYGRGAGSIAAEHDIPEEDAEEMRQAWFRQFPEAAEWLEELHRSPMTGRTVITPFGRRRRFGVVSRDNYHDLKNASANFPMQSSASDLTLFSGMRIQAKWDREGTDAHIVCLVHDALVVECDEGIKDRIAAELTAMMEDTPRRVLEPKIKFPVDVHIGRMWGTMKTEEMADTKTSTGKSAFEQTGVASGKL